MPHRTYQRPIDMADEQIAALLRQLINQQELNQKATEANCKALETLAKRLNGLSQAPFGVAFMLLCSGFFYIGRISEMYWIAGCAVAALPYYSEYVPMLLKLWNKKETK